MKLYSVDEVPLGRTSRTYQQSRWSGIVAVTLLGAVIGGLSYGIVKGEVPRGFWLLVGFFVFLELLFLSTTRAAFRPDNWVLKFDGTQVAIKFRSYLNAHFPREDAVVAVFPTSAFRGVRKATGRRHVPGSGRRQTASTEKWAALELELKGGDEAEALKHAILEEIRRKAPKRGARIKHHHTPVRMTGERTIHVSWRGSQDHVRPAIETALRQMGGAIPVLGEEHVEGRHWDDMTAEEFDASVADLAISGRTVHAASLLKVYRHMSMTEAKQRVQEILDRGE
jgi:hypothetical protein